MSMKMKERISGAIMLAIFTFAFVYSRHFPETPRLAPTFVSLLGIILSACLLIRSFFMRYEEEAEEEHLSIKQIQILLASIAIFCAYVMLISIIGYYVVTFLFIIGLSLLIDRTYKWWLYPMVAIGILAIIYVVFDIFLLTPMPTGLLI